MSGHETPVDCDAKKAALNAKSRAYYAANREKIKERARAWRLANRERDKATRLAYRKANPHRSRQWYLENKEARGKWHWQYQKNKMAANPSFAMYGRVLKAMNRAASRHKLGLMVSDRSMAVRLLGCCWQDFVSHIESQFKPGMSWENHGQSGWHFDHIRPLSSFDLTDEKQLLDGCHFTNVQPLWAADNVRKGAKT